MDEETPEVEPKYELGCVCTCLSEKAASSEKVEIPARKEYILSTVARTENYLRERRIPELIRYLFTKILAETSEKPIAYLEKLLDDCMLFRAGHGAAPVLYEKRHLEAVIKSFDPGNRGWLSAGQVRRMYSTLGLTPDILNDEYEERYPTDTVLEKVTIAQEMELFDLLASGMIMDSLFKDHRSEKSSMH